MSNKKLVLDVIEVQQSIGSYYITSIKAKDLLDISYVDRMRLDKEGKNEIASYLGIQRQLKQDRVKEIGEYIIDNSEASFPTSIILSITQDCAEINENDSCPENLKELILKELPKDILRDRIQQDLLPTTENLRADIENFKYIGIAKVLDGQHRLAGLDYAIREIQNRINSAPLLDQTENIKRLEKIKDFELNVSIFIGYDIHSQAMLFGTVNLAQTKVNKSIVYNLEEYSKIKSPQKTCHEIAKLLDSKDGSPFKGRIKMLGCKTQGREQAEPLTQAVFVESLLKLISKNPKKERDIERNKLTFRKIDKIVYSETDNDTYIFHNFFKDSKDENIAAVLWNYFSAVDRRWNVAWNDPIKSLLPKNNCFRALMRYLRDAYNKIGKPIPSIEDFLNIFNKFEIKDEDFDSTKENFPRGDGGMSKFYKYLSDQIDYNELKRN